MSKNISILIVIVLMFTACSQRITAPSKVIKKRNGINYCLVSECVYDDDVRFHYDDYDREW